MSIPEYVKARIKKSSPEYTRVDLSSCAISDDDVKELVELLRQNPFIQDVVLSRNSIGNKGAAYLANLPASVTSLDISSNNIDDEGLKLFYPHIQHVEKLNIGWNNLTSRSIDLFSTDTTCTYLNVNGNALNEIEIKTIDENIKLNLTKKLPSKDKDACEHSLNGVRANDAMGLVT